MRKQEGALGEGVEVERDVPLNWTTAQKADMRIYRLGQVLGFHRAVKGIAKNESVEVVRAEDNRVIIRNDRGEERAITTKQAKSFEVYERQAIEVAAGDRLLCTANRREPGFRVTNGETITVEGFDRGGSIHLADGRVVPRNFRQFDYGYAVTAHRSQGKLVDSVIISGDGMQKELFYVAASRGRKNVLVITSDKETLRESVGRSGARQSASELMRKARPGLHQGSSRGLEAARQLAMRAAQYQFQTIQAPILQQIVSEKPSKERTHEYGISR